MAKPARLMIKELVLENFKSYAGFQRIGPFHQSYSSIVGPNGSGKSNVIDGLLFVFGKRAKQMRLNKVSELIHKSTDYPNLDLARVSVYFQDIIDREGDSYDVVPGSEFVVSRTADKANASKYYINDRTSNFTEVTDLLKAKGIDLENNRFLILQGEVEQISLMKPKAPGPHEDGFLEYLEEIIGTNKYVQPIEDTLKEIEVLGEERAQKLGRMKMVEKEKENLQGAKDEAQDFLRQEKELASKKSMLFQLIRSDCEKQIEAVQSKKTELDAKHEHEKSKMSEHSAKLKSYEAAYKKEKDAYEKITKELKATEAEFVVFERKDVKLREDVKHLREKEKKIQQGIVKDRKKEEEQQLLRLQLLKEIEDLEKKCANSATQLKSEEAVLETMFAEIKDETERLGKALEKKEQDAAPWIAEAVEAKSALDVAKSEMKILADKAGENDRRREAVTQRLKTILEDKQRQASVLQETIATKEAVSKRLAQAKEELEKLKNEEQIQLKAVQEIRGKVEEARASLHNAKTRGNLLVELLKLKKSGKLPGIIGRLGDLGAIDSKYDVAISTACGALDYIVVDTTATGQACVEVLRECNLGRTTFIMMDKIRHDFPEKLDTPENVPRLFDLIRVRDPNLRPAFFYAIQNTLVAQNLEQATRIAFHGSRKWRVVTLNGELIDVSGTMAGGGKAIAKGGMGSSFVDGGTTSEEFKQLETELENRSAALAALKKQQGALQQEINGIVKKLPFLEGEVGKINLELKALEAQESDAQRDLKNLSSLPGISQEDGNRMQILEKELVSKEKQLAKAKAKADIMEAAVLEVKTQIGEAGGDRFKAQKAEVASLTKQRDDCQTGITKAKVGISTASKQAEKANKAVAAAEAEIVEVRAKLEAALAELKLLEKEATKVMESHEAAKKLQEAKEEELKAIHAQFEEFNKSVAHIRALQLDIEHQLEEYQRVIRDNQKKGDHWHSKLVELFKQQKNSDTDLLDEADEFEALREFSSEELSHFNREQIDHDVTALEESIKQMKPNMGAIAEYRRKEAEYLARVAELNAVTEKRDAVRAEHDSLRKRRLEEFMTGFGQITIKLKEMYQMITLGGDAELELVDSLDPFSEGVVFSVRPPKKSWKNICNLSGGEKTLSSLAFIFALHHYKPTPLYFMDEIDAALDFKNVSIVANYIKERTKNAQFIIISLRNNMFELADRLVGIYKTNNTTKSVTINPASFPLQLQPASASA